MGIGSCLLFAIWFLSGLVMIYVPFPTLTAQERQVGQETIAWQRVNVQPAVALASAGVTTPKSLTLEMRDTVPVWHIDTWEGERSAVSAMAGAPLPPVDEAMARHVASRFGNASVRALEQIERDQWTVSGSYDPHRPLWKTSLADPAGTELYVSSSTGMVVLDTTRFERFWNWLGSVPHWIYPTILRQDNAAWRQVVMWVSGPCIAAAVTGMWIGILRMQIGRRRYRRGEITPYHGWMWWHHIAGLTGGLALLAWIFSGWLSVDPFRLFASNGIGTAERLAYAHPATPSPLSIRRLAVMAPTARQMKVEWAAGRELLTFDRPGQPVVTIEANNLKPPVLTQNRIASAAAMLVPGARAVAVDRLTRPDAYWYDVGALPKLPVLRVRFNDAAQTWVHIDPATGLVVGETDSRRRLYRWFFDLLHKWDFNSLTLNRPAWDVLLWTLSILGLITSVSGIWIGWIRLLHSRPASRSNGDVGS